MRRNQQVLITLPELVKKPGYLYFIDKDGDLGRIRRATGHYPGRSGPLEKVKRLGIKKVPGYFYFLDGKNRILSAPMHRSAKPPRTQRSSRSLRRPQSPKSRKP